MDHLVPLLAGTLKVWCQNFNRRVGARLMNRSDGVHKVLRAPIRQIVTIHAGHHHMTQSQGFDSLGNVERLKGIQRLGLPVVMLQNCTRAYKSRP